MKPSKLDVTTDYRLALLWLMDRLESARSSEATVAFEREFGDLIPQEHWQTNRSGGVKWQNYVTWSRLDLVNSGLMGSGGRGVWTITPAGKAWLRENPRADPASLASFIRQGGDQVGSGFRWRGEYYSITKRALFSQARRLLQDDPPKEALRFRDWAVFVGDQPVSVKWLFALATGADYNEFDSPTARRALSQVGIEAQQVSEAEKPAPASARRPRGAGRAKRRDEFLIRTDGHAHAILEQQLAHIRTFLQGRSSRPSDEVLCDWVQFCYTFELFDEGYELFKLIVPSAVNDWLYGRTKRLAQVCCIRAQSKG